MCEWSAVSSSYVSPQVMFALRELPGSLLALIEMVVYCCFCNERFSFTVLHFIKVGARARCAEAPCSRAPGRRSEENSAGSFLTETELRAPYSVLITVNIL